MTESIKTAIALIGPTASGKTALSLEIAKHFPVEMISIDSALVYRGMDIGTAKPDRATLDQIPHHLIDIISPLQTYSAAQFRADCVQCMKDIQQRGKIPLLVGGTMLYVQALQKGLNNLPEADMIIRARLDDLAAEQGWPALHKQLASVDPETALRLSENDSQRIQRALEIYEITGQPMSTLLQQETDSDLPCRLFTIGLMAENRALLHERIAQRFDLMIDAGFLNEVSELKQQYPELTPSFPSMRCVGYRQAWHHLEGDTNFSTFRDQAIAATRQLCKRQLTWLRSMPLDYRYDAFEENLQEKLMQQVTNLLADATQDVT